MPNNFFKQSLVFLSVLLLTGFLYIYLKADIKHYINQELLPIAVPVEFFRANEKLIAATDKYKYLFLPTQIDSRAFSWTNNRTMGDFLTTSPSNLAGFSTNNIKTKNYLSFIKTQINHQPYWHKFISFLGVKYLFWRNDSVELSKKEKTDQLSYFKAQPEIEFKASDGLISNFEVGSATDSFYITDDYFLVVGGLEALEVLNSRKDFDPTNNGLIFTNQKIPLTKKNIEMIKNAKAVIFYRSEIIDLIFSIVPNKYWLWPADFTKSSASEWQQASTNDPLHGQWHKILETETGINDWNFDYGHNLVYARGEKILTIPFSINSANVYEIFVRYFKHPVSNDLKLTLDNEEITINSQAPGQQSGFVWQKISERQFLKDNYEITLNNQQGFNAINAIVIIPKNKLSDISTKIQDLLARNQLIYLDKFSQASLSLSLNLPTFLPQANKLEIYTADKERSIFSWQAFNETFNQATSWQLSAQTESMLSIQNLSNLDIGGQSITNQNNQTVAASIPADSPTPAHRLATNLIKIEPKSDLFITYKLTGENLNNLTARILFYESDQKAKPVSLTVTEIMGEKRGNVNNAVVEQSFKTPAGAEWLRLEFRADKPLSNSKYFISNLLLNKADKFIPVGYIASLPVNFSFTSDKQENNNDLTYQKINPTEYQIKIKPIKKPKLLIFSQSFDPYWQLTENKKSTSQPLSAYSLLNGFYLNPDTGQNLTLKFKPQTWFKQGLLASAATIATCSIIIVSKKIVKQKNKIIDEN